MASKVCTRCKENKPYSEFHLDGSTKTGRKSRCKLCVCSYRRENYDPDEARKLRASEGYKSYHKQYRADNQERIRDLHLRSAFGITLEQYNLLLEEQGYVCAVCQSTCEVKGTLAVDHNHDTGEVRGLLCQRCNTGIGKLGDSEKLLERALKYLRGGKPWRS